MFFIGVAVYLTGVVILNETFADDLTDPTSDTYQRKATDVCSEVNAVLCDFCKESQLIQDIQYLMYCSFLVYSAC